MSDEAEQIVERLRDHVVDVPGHGRGVRASLKATDLLAAADLIDRLIDRADAHETHIYELELQRDDARARAERLEAALWPFVNGGVPLAPLTREEMDYVRAARAALEDKT